RPRRRGQLYLVPLPAGKPAEGRESDERDDEPDPEAPDDDQNDPDDDDDPAQRDPAGRPVTSLRSRHAFPPSSPPGTSRAGRMYHTRPRIAKGAGKGAFRFSPVRRRLRSD